MRDDRQLTDGAESQEEFEDDIEPFWRGVFAIDCNRDVIAEFPITCKISELPTWSPTIDINPRWFEEDDE